MSGSCVSINGECGPADGQKLDELPTAESELCNRGTATNITTTSTGWTWTCEGSNGGSDASCQASLSRGFIEVP